MMKQVEQLAIGDSFLSYSGVMTVTQKEGPHAGKIALTLKDQRGKRDTMVLGKSTFVSVLQNTQ